MCVQEEVVEDIVCILLYLSKNHVLSIQTNKLNFKNIKAFCFSTIEVHQIHSWFNLQFCLPMPCSLVQSQGSEREGESLGYYFLLQGLAPFCGPRSPSWGLGRVALAAFSTGVALRTGYLLVKDFRIWE